jgi:hypothetical protein
MTRWVSAGAIDNRFEGDRVSQALEEAGIPYMIKSFLDTAYDGLYVPQKGWGKVVVLEEWHEKAGRIVAEVKMVFREEEKDETE